jgi:hypothetical protein
MHGSLTTPRFSADDAEILLIPPSDDIFSRYCHDDTHVVSRLRSVKYSSFLSADRELSVDPVERTLIRSTVLYGSCEEDSDCNDSSRPFCMEGVCRECRDARDCSSPAMACSAQTEYTCSDCEADDDCLASQVCRKSSSHRKECVSCPSSVPFNADLVVPHTCAWSCPVGMGLSTSTSSSCSLCPQCGDNEFYAPSDSSSRKSFLTTCTNSTGAVCVDCTALVGIPSNDPHFCAIIKSPTEPISSDASVGDLGPKFPCRFFQCKSGWFLDLSVNKCTKCHYSMCQPGEFLDGCSNEHPGKCTACPEEKPVSASWIEPDSKSCKFVCPIGTELDEDSGECVRCKGCGRNGQTVHSIDEE